MRFSKRPSPRRQQRKQTPSNRSGPLRGEPRLFRRSQTIAALVLTPVLAFGFTLTDVGGVLSAQAVDDTMTTVPADSNAAKKAQDQTTPAPETTPSTDTTPSPVDTPAEVTPEPTDPVTDTPVDPGTDPSADPTPAPEPEPAPEPDPTPKLKEAPGLNKAKVAAADDAVITPLSVPAPTTSTSVITVKVGGDRSTLTSVAPLAGVTLQLYNGGAGGPDASPRPEAWASCVSDADGDCSFTIPDTQNATGGNPAGVNRNARF